MRKVVRQEMAAKHMKAAIVKVPIDGQELLTEAFGTSMTNVPATTDMHFRNGAVAISYISTLLMQLVDEKKVSLDDKVSKWLPDVKFSDQVTLGQLAPMTSGYFDYIQDEGFIKQVLSNPFRQWTPEELVAVATSHPLLYPPGTNWSYAHSNYEESTLWSPSFTITPGCDPDHEHRRQARQLDRDRQRPAPQSRVVQVDGRADVAGEDHQAGRLPDVHRAGRVLHLRLRHRHQRWLADAEPAVLRLRWSGGVPALGEDHHRGRSHPRARRVQPDRHVGAEPGRRPLAEDRRRGRAERRSTASSRDGLTRAHRRTRALRRAGRPERRSALRGGRAREVGGPSLRP